MMIFLRISSADQVDIKFCTILRLRQGFSHDASFEGRGLTIG